jgi:phosphoenolpyruvate carboxykinase (ATP)
VPRDTLVRRRKMFKQFEQAGREIYETALHEGRLLYNPTGDDLRKFAVVEPEVKQTKYGNIMAQSEPTSRAAAFTKNNIDSEFGEEERRLLEQAKKSLSGERLTCIDVEVGDGQDGTTARLIVPTRFAHVAYGGVKLFKQTAVEEPTYQIIMFFDDEYEANKTKVLPKKSITIRNAHSPEGKLVKIVRNSNYIGEWKKGVFTGQDYLAKQTGKGIFLHAGCRNDYLETAHGGYQAQTSLFVALSANGKTSLTCRVLARKGKEKSWLVQDDGGILTRDGSFLGFEAGGVFVKTDALNPRDQIETYYGILKPDSFMENVCVADDGDVDFYNIERTSNGRAVIERRDFMHASYHINVEKVDNIFLITRGSIMPAIARLTPKEATVWMILGMAMESSAGDPTQAGKIRSVFFYDPFVAGNRADHARLFDDTLEANPDIQCYLLNTGGVGEGPQHRDIGLSDTIGILDSVLRGGLEDWVQSPLGLMVPRSVRAVDSILFHPERLFTSAEFAARKRALQTQQAETLERYSDLPKRIREAYLR